MRPHRTSLKGTLKGVWTLIGERNLSLIASGIAYYGILALFPAIAAVIAIWGFFADPAAVEAQLADVLAPLPSQVTDLLQERVADLVAADATTLGWAGLLSVALSLWSARAGVASMMIGLNSIYDEDNRSGLKHVAVAFGLTIVMVVLAILTLVALLGVPVLLAVLPLGPAATLAAEIGRWVVAAGAVIFGLGVLYRYGPKRRDARVGWISPGAVSATVLWGLATVAFSIYLRNFGSYNEVYGSIGAVIVLLLWLYISSFVCLLGAALNAEMELREARDTTIGPDRPMGERGAYVADNLERPNRDHSEQLKDTPAQ
jgi:membrane protein